MRFMVLVKASKDSEAGMLPDEKMIIEMGKFNEKLVNSGMLLAAEGLQASSKGSRIDFSSGKPVVTDGPFSEAKELVAGYWLIQAASKDEAIEMFKHCPHDVGEIEIRKVFDSEDFAPVINTDEGRATMEAEQEFRKRANG